MRGWISAVLTGVTWLLTAGSALPGEPQAGRAPWFDLEVPGGAAAAAKAVGLAAPIERARVMLELVRRQHDGRGGHVRSTELQAKLRAHLEQIARSGDGQADVVPLPLSPDVWRAAVFKQPVAAGDLFGAILVDRNAALLYHGLASLDDPTLLFLAEHPDTLRQIYTEHAAPFARFGRSIHVREGRVQVPGGAAAVGLWEALVDRRAANASGFIDALLRRDDGRLALFYDTAAHLDPPQLRFALGMFLQDARVRVDRFRALYRVVARADRWWNIRLRPFERAPIDLALLLMQLDVAPDGVMRPPASRALWAEIFDEDRPAGGNWDGPRAAAPDAVDAAWLAERLLVSAVAERRDRLETLLFGQRVFGPAPAAAARDVVLVLRPHARYRALMLTLERVGITGPAAYAAAAARAATLDALDGRQRIVALTLFQAALALVDRARLARTLAAEDAARLVTSLIAIEPSADGGHGGRVAAWMDEQMLPTLAGAMGARWPADDVDGLVLSALAGASGREGDGRPAARPVVEWEGLTYDVDPPRAELSRLRRMCAGLGSVSLDAVLRVARGASSLADSAATRELRDRARKTREAVEALHAAGLERDHADGREGAIAQLLTLERLDDDRLRGQAQRSAPALVALADALLADALRSLVYAISLGDPDGPVLLGGNVARRHRFDAPDAEGAGRGGTAWSLPREQRGTGVTWHVSGSLLALDVGLARLALRRLSLEQPPQAPVLSETDRRIFIEGVALMNPSDLADADRDAIARALAAGRARVAGLVAEPQRLDELAGEAGLDEWRHAALRWAIVREPQQAPRMFSLLDLLWLGWPDTAGRPRLDAWGASALPLGGCLCLNMPSPRVWAGLAGRGRQSLLAAGVVELSLRVAEALAELGLPAAIARSVLAMAVQDYVDEVQPAHLDDWATLARSAQAIPRDRIEDYVSALTAGGPLVPKDE